ncbi:hypothetical protein M422DRAFT_778329 [Sphaerobolus stellatus SS14]|uniref:DUF6699 domain-containing protein n=1 Tax=Sphaerobolus stellatus (strain SS14) TaxID=990650 RepID=A0A0C9UV52_SPHS4|nr:hypothetical protein M422DRAFT_778329 [Sphaerobolus stellatus SS14]
MPAGFSMPHLMNDPNVDVNPPDEVGRSPYQPGYDAHVWNGGGGGHTWSGGHSRSARSGRREGDTWGPAAANDWDGGGAQPRRSHSRDRRAGTTRIGNLGAFPYEREPNNAAHFDTGRPRRQRAASTDEVLSHPFWSPGAAFGHARATGWGNDDEEEEEAGDYFEPRRSRRSKRHSTSHRRFRDPEEQAEYDNALNRNETEWSDNHPRGGPPGWDDSLGDERRGISGPASVIAFAEPPGDWGATGGHSGGGTWSAADGHSGGGVWGTTGATDWRAGETQRWGNTAKDDGLPPLLGDDNGTGVNRSYKVKRSPERSSAGSSYTFVRSKASSGPIRVHDVPPSAFERSKSDSGPGFKNIVKSLIGNSSLHPFLRPPSLLHPTTFAWDIRRPPHPARSGIRLGEAIAGIDEPATDPPRQHIRVIIQIPNLGGAYWTVDVSPKGGSALETPSIPFTFLGSPTSFGRSQLKRTKSRPGDNFSSYVRVSDVLFQVYQMLHKNARREDYEALLYQQQKQVSQAFYMRCHELEGPDGRMLLHRPGPGTEEIDEEVQKRVDKGLKRIDFMDGKTRDEGLNLSYPLDFNLPVIRHDTDIHQSSRWEGLDAGKEPDTWIMRLGKNNERPL